MAVTATPASRPSDVGPGTAGIELRGVTKRYGDNVALKDLDLDIRDGEFFCLLGPSGCGKTTTLNLIGGFVGPTAGTIWLRGRRIDNLPPHKRPVNTVFQSYALFPHMSVRENVGFGLRMDHVKRAEASQRGARVQTPPAARLDRGEARLEVANLPRQAVDVARHCAAEDATARASRSAVLPAERAMGSRGSRSGSASRATVLRAVVKPCV